MISLEISLILFFCHFAELLTGNFAIAFCHCYIQKGTVIKKESWEWLGKGSVGKMFASQAHGLSLDPQHSCRMSGLLQGSVALVLCVWY